MVFLSFLACETMVAYSPVRLLPLAWESPARCNPVSYTHLDVYKRQALNSGAHLTGLIRTRVGDVRLEDCLSVESFPEWLDRCV